MPTGQLGVQLLQAEQLEMSGTNWWDKFLQEMGVIQAEFSMLSIKHCSFLFNVEPIFAELDLPSLVNHRVLRRTLVLVELKSNYSIPLIRWEKTSLMIHFLYSSPVFLLRSKGRTTSPSPLSKAPSQSHKHSATMTSWRSGPQDTSIFAESPRALRKALDMTHPLFSFSQWFKFSIHEAWNC